MHDFYIRITRGEIKIAIARDFIEFLKKYGIISLAVAFIVGAAATDLVKTFVNQILMPVIMPFIPSGEWQVAKLTLGPIVIGWGAFLGSFINFLIMAIIVFLILKPIISERKPTKNKKLKKIKKAVYREIKKVKIPKY